MIFFIFYLFYAKALLTYDQGIYVVFSSSQTCQQVSQSTIIPFNGVFNLAPQVIIELEYLNFNIGTDYRLSITTITINNFEVVTYCPTVLAPDSELQFYWYAIDDQRIQVINNFDMVNLQNKTFQHENANANKGILSITSLGIQGIVDFQISISTINQTQVTVNIIGKFVNLNQIGYQIIFGNDEAFLQQQSQYLKSNYTSGILTQQPDRWLFLSFYGLNMTNNLKQRLLRTSYSVSYTLETFDLAEFVACYHQRTWLAYKFTKVYKAFECQSVRFIQTYDKDISTKPQFQINITELSLSLSLNSQFNTIINNTANSLTFKIFVSCTLQKKIMSKFLKCQDCSTNKYYQFSHYCNGQIDEVIYYLQYQTSLQAYKNLTFNLATDIFTIQQVLYNQVKTTQTIMDIQIVNQ